MHTHIGTHSWRRRKTLTKFLIPTQQGNLPYHVTIDSHVLSS